MRRRVVPFVTALAAVAVLGAGCGLTEEGPRPGVAAELDGETLALEQVDEAVQEYCELRAAHPEAAPASRADIRSQFVLGWTQAVAVEHLADDYDVSLPPESINATTVEQNWGELGTIDEENYDAFEFLTWIQLRLTTPVEHIGGQAIREETGQLGVGQPAVDRGIAVIQEWLGEHDLDLNPVFGELDPETGQFAGDGLSVPVSDEAQAASAERSDEEIANLPADQRCGPAATTAEVPAA